MEVSDLRDRGRLFVLLFGGRGLGAEKERNGCYSEKRKESIV